jgi:zona occludens toxin
MIYLITGVPGSGKTLYAVSTLVKQLTADKVKSPSGEMVERRLCVDAVTGLIIPHEMMAPGKFEPDGSLVAGEGNGVWNWHEWCKPGDVIFVDEVQRWWRPRGNGVKPPADIKALETHRHKGVDLIIVTQNPMLIDQNVRRLVGRHINVRRMFGGARAVLYDWDSCSADVSRVSTATKSYWSYPKDAYKLYQSSELHTKQKQKIPLWLAVPLLAGVGFVFVAPKAFGVMSGAMTGKGVTAVVPVASKPQSVASVPITAASSPSVAASAAVAAASVPVEASKFAGCMSSPKKCVCFDSSGSLAKVDPGFCESYLLGNSMPGQKADLSQVANPSQEPISESDLDMLAFMSKHQVR